MQINTDSKIPDFFLQNEKFLFWIAGIFSLLFLCAGIFLERNWLCILPFSFFIIGIAVLNFRYLFYLLMLVLPISVEAEFGSIGTDLPSEPLLILLALCTLFFVARNFHLLYPKQLKHPITLMLIALFLWSCVSTIYSTDVIVSVKYLLAKSWYLLGFFVLPIILLKSKKSIQTFFWCLFVPTFLSVIYILIRHSFSLFTFESINPAVHPIYRNHVTYAVFITMVFPFIFLAKTWYPKSSRRYALLNFSIPIFLLAIYFSYTRGAWIAVVLMLAFYFVLEWKLTKIILLVSAIAVLIFSVYILKDNNYLKYAPNYEHTIYHEDLSEHLTSTFEMEDMSTVERFYRWIAAVHLFKEHPMVGVGPNNFVANYKPYTVTAYETYISDNEERSTVHNYFLLMLTEQGIPALVLFVLLVVIIMLNIQHIYTAESNKMYILTVALCLITFLFNNTLSDLVEANKVGSLFFICLALLVNFDTAENEQKLENAAT